MQKQRFHRMIPAVFVFLFGLIASFCITFQVYNLQQAQTHTSVQSIANSRLSLFQQLLDQRINISKTIEALIFNNNGDISGMEPVIQELYRYNSPTISAMELAPDGVVTYTYPPSKEHMAETDLFASGSSDEFVYSRNTQRNMINIYNSSQLIVYNPIYLREKGTGYDTFWGFAIVICPFDSMLEDSRIDELGTSGYHYRITMRSSFNHSTAVIAESSSDWDASDAETFEIEEPGYQFTLAILPERGWNDLSTIVLTAVVCGILTFLVTILTISFIHQRESNELLSELSSQDSLTKLPNSRSFHTACELLKKDRRDYTMFFLDANHFKEINDTYGHSAGNEVLCEYGILLSRVFGDQVYRLGGDEFAAIVQKRMSTQEADDMIQKVNAVLSESYIYEGNVIPLSMSIGWAVSDADLTNDRILRQADRMMYINKQKYHDAEKKSTS